MTTTADPTPVPLRRWQVTWRNLAAIGFGALLWLPLVKAQWQLTPLLVVSDVVLGVISFTLMQFRRRWPWWVAFLTTLVSSFSATSLGSSIVAYVSMSTRRRWVEILSIGALSVFCSQVYFVVQPSQDGPWYINLILAAAITGVIAAVGMYIGARRELLANLQDRAERAEREQELKVATAQANERTRIAREMHDVLAHRMSLVALHAGALAYRDDLTVSETRETAEIIQANSHRALTDLREILGVLRDAERGIDATNHRPQPTLADLDSLLADERAAGANITVAVELNHLDDVPESIARTAYRIVQEGLTNARKHSANAAVVLSLSGAPGRGLTVEVRNPLRVGSSHENATSSGFGLIGLAERVAATHGRFLHGRTPDGSFVVRAWLPWQS
ncbi:MAG: histidine kinase [Nocardioidaceae bacterium]